MRTTVSTTAVAINGGDIGNFADFRHVFQPVGYQAADCFELFLVRQEDADILADLIRSEQSG